MIATRARACTAVVAVIGIAATSLVTGAGTASATPACTTRIIVDSRIFSGTAGGPQQATNAALRNARSHGFYGAFKRLTTNCG